MSDEPRDSARPRARLLLVADQADAEVARFAEACAAAGWNVDRVGDVYLAMGRLATGSDAIARVVVDARSLDAGEMQFMDLAQRYYGHVSVHELSEFVHGNGRATLAVEPRPEASARLAQPAEPEPMEQDDGGPFAQSHVLQEAEVAQPEAATATSPMAVRTFPDDGIPEGLDPIYDDAASDESVVAPPVDAARDGESPIEDDGGPALLSLHDEVRRRMLAGANAEGVNLRPVQRIPPSTRRATVEPPRPAAPPESPPTGQRAPLTKEELDALLGDAPEERKEGAS